MKQDEKQDNMTLSQLIQLCSLAYPRQPLFQRQVSNFMKALFLFDHRKWVENHRLKLENRPMVRLFSEQNKLKC